MACYNFKEEFSAQEIEKLKKNVGTIKNIDKLIKYSEKEKLSLWNKIYIKYYYSLRLKKHK